MANKKKDSFVFKLQALLIASLIISMPICASNRKTATIINRELASDSLPTCIGPFTCDGERNICARSRYDGVHGSITIDDSGYSVTSDGKGPYFHGDDNERIIAVATVAIVLAWGKPAQDTSSARYLTIDINHPVPGDIGQRLGVIKDSYAELAAQWYAEPISIDSLGRRRLQHNSLDIPIGSTVLAQQINIGVHINGRYHILQMGPQPTGHCFDEGTAIYGDGTTQATISRVAEKTWIVEAKNGSIARLFDTYHTNKFAVNRGRYFISFRYVLQGM